MQTFGLWYLPKQLRLSKGSQTSFSCLWQPNCVFCLVNLASINFMALPSVLRYLFYISAGHQGMRLFPVALHHQMNFLKIYAG